MVLSLRLRVLGYLLFLLLLFYILKNNLCLGWKWPNDVGDPASTKFKPLTVIRGFRDSQAYKYDYCNLGCSLPKIEGLKKLDSTG